MMLSVCTIITHYMSLMPASCNVCRKDFSLTHTLDCGLVTQRHNEIMGDLDALGYKEVVMVCNGTIGNIE